MRNFAFIDNNNTNFGHLIQRVSEKNDQIKFVNQWSQHYANAFKNSPPEALFEWNIRLYKSLKEVFTATCFYQESLIAKESGSWAAFYFLSYYSLFHALLANVVLIPSETIKKLSEINHTKLIALFKSTFSDHKPHIIRSDIDKVFYMFKYLREYYSYNMPPNDFLYESDDNIKPDIALPYFLRSCSQLASLLSELIERAAHKHGKEIINLDEHSETVSNWFQILNCPKHPVTGTHLLHFTDEVRLAETIRFPTPVSFVTELEHFTDEFRLYEGARFPRHASGEEINPGAFVYRMLCR
ncbi:MAG: hypothetical protein Q7U37_00550 [Gallionella sp.]|nr:hypothetical protein [Gallionella sp.]